MRAPVFVATAVCCAILVQPATAFLPAPAAVAGRAAVLPSCSRIARQTSHKRVALEMTSGNREVPEVVQFEGRRRMLRRLAACGCGACLVSSGLTAAPQSASALAQIAEPPADVKSKWDLLRNAEEDEMFACGMATGMEDYELAVSKVKAKLFGELVEQLPRGEPVVAELGSRPAPGTHVTMGSFPNANFLAKANTKDRRLDLIGIDPNDKMEKYARQSAKSAGLLEKSSLRIVHGVAEAIPLETASCDAVVCTLTLCSVVDPERAVSEIRRVLKPGGKFLFWEHVLSETDEDLARSQRALTAWQVKRADGCHLDRQTLKTITASSSGFTLQTGGYFDLKGFNILNPTVAGIAA